MYYAPTVNLTVLVVLSAITSDHGSLTKNTMRKTLQFLDYMATHPDVILTFKRSSMALNVHSNRSYLCEPTVRSRTGGQFFLLNSDADPKDNGAVLNIANF